MKKNYINDFLTYKTYTGVSNKIIIIVSDNSPILTSRTVKKKRAIDTENPNCFLDEEVVEEK